MLLRKALLTSAFAAIATMAFSSVCATTTGGSFGQGSDYALQQELQQINDLARANGTIIQDLKVNQSVRLGANSLAQAAAQGTGTSCTVTAQVVIHGVGATVSATASTCLAAAKMIANFVKNMPSL